MANLPNLFGLSTLKSALSYVEQVIPPASAAQAQPREIDKDVTAKVQKYVSPSFLGPLLRRLLVDIPESEKRDGGVIVVDDESEKDIDAINQLDRYLCDDSIQNSVLEFHKTLHARWPVGCNPAHKSMLRLTASRKYEHEKDAKVLAFDTLSSGHGAAPDTYWGRVTFVLK